jgi:hypothetical protein
VVTATCEGCGTTFEAKTARRKWCTDACKVRTQRARRSQSEHAQAPIEPAGTAEGAPTSGLTPEDPMITAVRKQLAASDAVDTVDGQIALHLAKQVKAATGSAAASLAKELHVVLERVTPTAPPPPPNPGQGPSDDADDPAAEARKAKEAKEAKAAAAAAAAEAES